MFKKDYNKSFDFIRLPVLLYLLLIDLILNENFLQLAKEYLDFKEDHESIGEKLTSLGLEVEGIKVSIYPWWIRRCSDRENKIHQKTSER